MGRDVRSNHPEFVSPIGRGADAAGHRASDGHDDRARYEKDAASLWTGDATLRYYVHFVP